MSFSRKHNPVTQNSPQTYYFPSAELDTCLFFNIMELNGTRIVLLKAWKMKKLQNKNEKLSCNVSKVPSPVLKNKNPQTSFCSVLCMFLQIYTHQAD